MLLNRIKETLRNFAGNTTLHGIDRISSRTHFIGKLLWACIVLTCVSACFIQIYKLGVQYASKQVSTKVFIKNQKLYFPAVSFCNLNPLSFLKMQEDYIFFDDYKIIIEKIKKTFEDSAARKERDVQRKSEDSQDTDHIENSNNERTADDLDILSMLKSRETFTMRIFDYHRRIFHDDTELFTWFIKVMSADFSEFVIHCKFEGRQCNESMFVPFFDKFYGQCYRFSSNSIITTRAGPLFALQLLINVNQSDYVPYIASEAGIRLSIHEHDSQPFLENNGFSVATGFRTDVSLSQKRIERMPGTTLCDTSNNFSSINACFEKCVERNEEIKCRCWDDIDGFDTIRHKYYCFSDDHIECVMNARGNVTGCKCNSPCSEKQYMKTIHTSRWPAKSYEGLLDKILKMKGLSLSNTSDSLLQVNIYFSSLYEEVTEEILSFTFENFLSNIGGALGLWIGMSAISFGELLELCFFLMRNMMRRNRAKENLNDVSVNAIGETTDQNITQSVHIDMSIIHEVESRL